MANWRKFLIILIPLLVVHLLYSNIKLQKTVEKDNEGEIKYEKKPIIKEETNSTSACSTSVNQEKSSNAITHPPLSSYEEDKNYSSMIKVFIAAMLR